MCNNESEREFAEASTVAAVVDSSKTPVSLDIREDISFSSDLEGVSG